MKKICSSLVSILLSTTALANNNNVTASYSEDIITCDIKLHPGYNKVIVYGSNEIHFQRIDGVETSAHHDGFNLTKVNDSYFAVYGGSEDLLFFMSGDGFGHVQTTGFENENDKLIEEVQLYPISNCIVKH